jgi:hypothetical protein
MTFAVDLGVQYTPKGATHPRNPQQPFMLDEDNAAMTMRIFS